MEEANEMTVAQIAKLAEWLQMQGHTAEEVLDCIRYIAGRPEKNPGKEKGLADQPRKQHS